MTISDFVEKYYLHDSCLNEIIVDQNKSTVRLIVDFCNWMQDDYVEGEAETSTVEIVFSGVSKIENLNRNIDRDFGDEFIAVEAQKNNIFYAELCTMEEQETYEIRIQAEDAQIIKRETSNE